MGADFDAASATLNLAAATEHKGARAHLSQVLRRHFQPDDEPDTTVVGPVVGPGGGDAADESPSREATATVHE